MNQELKKFSYGLAEAAKSAGAFTLTVRSRRRLPATGIALDADTILTAAHVIEDDENIQIVLPDGTQVAAELLGYDPNSDLAVLKLETASATPAATEDAIEVGELVLALGRPFKDVQASLGTLSAKSGPVQYRSGGMLEGHYRTDATPYPGFSGGPLINVEGKVVGINTSGLGIGNSVVIPIGVAVKVAAMLKEHGTVKRGYLGISSQTVDLPEGAQKALGRDQESGLLIVDLEEDGPAAGSGMMIGDILVGFGGEAVENHRQLMAQLSRDVVDKEIDVDLLRGGKPETLKIIIGERPDFHAEGRARYRARFARHWGGRHSSRHHWSRGHHERHGNKDHGSEDE